MALLLHDDPAVISYMQSLPPAAQDHLLALRAIILETAEDMPEVSELQEASKWRQPSYSSTLGTTIRIDWKAKAPQQYALYCSCQSLVIPSCRLVYPALFTYEGNRAIVFDVGAELPLPELQYIIRAALLYHRVKRIPRLGL